MPTVVCRNGELAPGTSGRPDSAESKGSFMARQRIRGPGHQKTLPIDCFMAAKHDGYF
jgi:hypothetical protein